MPGHPKTRARILSDGPWLAGMTLKPGDTSEAWCHGRGYVCMIDEFGGRPTKAGETFSAAFIVGWLDSIEEMERTYDRDRAAVPGNRAPTPGKCDEKYEEYSSCFKRSIAGFREPILVHHTFLRRRAFPVRPPTTPFPLFQ